VVLCRFTVASEEVLCEGAQHDDISSTHAKSIDFKYPFK
jgi:hypothetical protein